MFPPQEDFKTQMAEARRMQILAGASQVFMDKGYHKATTKEIAKAAGISEGTIYNYFDNKRELLLAMIDLIASQSMGEVSQVATAEPRVFLKTLLRNRYHMLHQRGPVMAPILAEIFSDKELREAVYQQVATPVIATLERYIQAQIEAGVFRPCNPMIVSRAIVGATILNDMFKITNLDPRYAGISVEVMIDEITEFFLKGLAQG
ncbi:MAG: TetR/AcrR family transcriptional regulator [Anaerolineae bacterium]|nr:TetR/AcrR family transcriptional regulator [Anaerolineae bacterium]